ncbi:hypothetical protein TMatcc_001207 [Talaromyces marneffei ATCC 18224]
MYSLFSILTTISGLSSLAAANGTVGVYNNCLFNVFVWTDNHMGSQNLILTPGTHYIEHIRRSIDGVDLKITITPDGLLNCAPQTHFHYNWHGDEIYYVIYNSYGDPLDGHSVVLAPVQPKGPHCKHITWFNGFPRRSRTYLYKCGDNSDLALQLCGVDPHPLSDDLDLQTKQ